MLSETQRSQSNERGGCILKLVRTKSSRQNNMWDIRILLLHLYAWNHWMFLTRHLDFFQLCSWRQTWCLPETNQSVKIGNWISKNVKLQHLFCWLCWSESYLSERVLAQQRGEERRGEERRGEEEAGGGSMVGWGLRWWSATPHSSGGKQIIRAMRLQSSKVHAQAPSAPPLITLSSIWLQQTAATMWHRH